MLQNKITIDIFSDTICPWCYIGKKNLEFAINDFPNNKFDIIWRPFQLNPDISKNGMDRQIYLNKKFGNSYQASSVYKSINEAGKKINIFFQFDKIHKTPNSFASHKLLAFGHKKGKQNQIIESIFYAYFIEGKDIGKLNELIIIAKQNKLSVNETRKYLNSSVDSEGLLQEELEARKMGIKGVPCFIINKELVLFGAQDKMKFVDIFQNLIK